MTPNSAIYFYQFSSPSAPSNLTWTTRFTIAGADGSTTAPANQTQPDGQSIPWGLGALVDPSTAVAAPSYLVSSSATGGNTVVVTASSSAAAGTTSAAAGTTSAAGVTGPASSTSSGFVTASAAPSSSASTNVSAAQQNTTSGNGAASLLGTDSYAVRAGAALGLAAFTFAFAL